MVKVKPPFFLTDASVWTDNLGANRNSLTQVDDHMNIGTTSTANNAPGPKNLAVYGSATFNGAVSTAAGQTVTLNGPTTCNDNVTVATGKSITAPTINAYYK